MNLHAHLALDLSAWTANDWRAFGSVATAAIALIAALVAIVPIRQGRRLRLEQARPFVVVDIRPSAVWWNILNLVIENAGQTMAQNVKIQFDPPLTTAQKGYDLAGSALLVEGIRSMPPGRSIDFLFDVAPERIEAKLPMRYEATVTFDDWRGRAQDPLRYTIDLNYLVGLQRVDEYGVHHAAKALREMSSTLKKWATGDQRLHVWTRDEDEELLKARIEEDLTGHLPTMATIPPSDLAMSAGRSVLVRPIVRRFREWRERHRSPKP